ncbi:MAG: RNA-guided endonuclease InsQ/TnpB family protein [Methanohalobium sp.]|uniref:RNA-guided endonuclease InsQ/TnpB family protein n=1 Tax=Methanohalobium sp. TaxID=2837493 RepID=UPI00397B9A89
MRLKMRFTRKLKVYPSEEQKNVLWNLSEQCRLLYNLALNERLKEAKHNGKIVTYQEQQKRLPVLKKKYPQYWNVHSKVLQMVLITVDSDYKSYQKQKDKGMEYIKPPKFKSRKYFTTLRYQQSGFKINSGKISLSHNYNDVPLEFNNPHNFKIKNVKQVILFNDKPYQGKGDYYVAVTYELNFDRYSDNKIYQAIDLGVSKTVTAINTKGKFFESITPRPEIYWGPVLDSLSNRIENCKENSRKQRKLINKYHKINRKKHNQIKDYLHKLSKNMVENTKANTLIIGDLSINNSSFENNYQTYKKLIKNNGYLSRFIELLTYKAEIVGKKVIIVDESHTSKLCYSCGKRHEMTTRDRIMDCDCGNFIDRDQNSAINIMLRYLSQYANWTGYRDFLDNLRQTGLPMVRHPEVNTRRNIVQS